MKTPHKHCLVLPFYTLSDPTSRHTIESLLQDGWRVTVLQPPTGLSKHPPMKGVRILNTRPVHLPRYLRPLQSAFNWYRFRQQIKNLTTTLSPELVVTFMLHPLALLPQSKKFKILACVYDIPALPFVGRLDHIIIKEGWRRLKGAETVWASDQYKANLAQEFGALAQTPLVCYNCPNADQFPQLPEREPWLRDELKRQGAALGDEGGNILLRAGAIGEACGIEETLEAMKSLPQDFIFLMMGRPNKTYTDSLMNLIKTYDLESRAFFWDRPNDEIWRKALQGADIGHLIHRPLDSPLGLKSYEFNSSMSNYRLFDYMATGLPIIGYDDPRMKAIFDEVDCFRVASLTNLVEDIKNNWFELGSSPILRRSMGANGMMAYQEKYNWQQQFQPVMRKVRSAFS